MNPLSIQPPNYFRVALHSALAAALFLGFPAGLLFWLLLLTSADTFVATLQANGINKIIVLTVSSFGWSYLLGRISGYRLWWKIGFATAAGIILAWLSPLSNVDGWFADGLPLSTLYALTMCGLVASVTLSVGLAYGILLRNFKAALTMAFTTSFISVLSLLLVIFIFDQFGFRVGGEVPLAMSKVTTVSLLASAITGGATLGVEFSWFVDERSKNLD